MVHWIVSSSLRLRVLVVAFAAVLWGAGVWQLRGTPLDVVPEFSPLSLQVKTEALGLPSPEVEPLITVPLEADLLNGVPWRQSIEAEPITGLSSIETVFAPSTDLMQARQMVQKRLTQAHALPNVSNPPRLLQPVSTASRILNIGLSSKTVPLIEMSVQAQWNVVPRPVGVPGVANASVWGPRKRQAQLQVDPAQLHANNLTLEQVAKTAGEAVWASALGIMMINHFQRLEQFEGETFGIKLVLRGARERLTPILMTTGATGLAILPLVLYSDLPGHEIEYPMAVVILGGLVTSTLLNLFVVPALYLRFGGTMAMRGSPAAPTLAPTVG